MNISEEKFAEIVETHQSRIKHLCKVYTNRTQDEKDLFQEILIQIWKSLPSFKGDAEISTWMYRIGVNTAISFIRKKKTREGYYSSYQKEKDNDGTDYYEHKYSRQDERTQKLYKAIDKLNVLEKAIITMYLDDFSYREIGFVTDMTENYVGVKLNRIKKKLSKVIDD